MTDIQLYFAVGLPILLNAAMVGLLMAYLNAKIEGPRRSCESRACWTPA